MEASRIGGGDVWAEGLPVREGVAYLTGVFGFSGRGGKSDW